VRLGGMVVKTRDWAEPRPGGYASRRNAWRVNPRLQRHEAHLRGLLPRDLLGSHPSIHEITLYGAVRSPRMGDVGSAAADRGRAAGGGICGAPRAGIRTRRRAGGDRRNRGSCSHAHPSAYYDQRLRVGGTAEGRDVTHGDAPAFVLGLLQMAGQLRRGYRIQVERAESRSLHPQPERASQLRTIERGFGEDRDGRSSLHHSSGASTRNA
jgi:hypothetical protein